MQNRRLKYRIQAGTLWFIIQADPFVLSRNEIEQDFFKFFP